MQRFVTVSVLAVLLVAGFPMPVATAQAGCVLPGMSIQAALDAAPAGGTVEVCGGVHFQQVVVRKDGQTLRGQAGAVLDGTPFVGHRVGVLVDDGVEGFTLEGFEIRNWKDPLATNDKSTAIAARGATSGIVVRNNTIHDNGWSALLVVRRATDWKVQDNVFRGHSFAPIVFQNTTTVTVQRNVMEGNRYGIIASDVADLTITDNVVRGSGEAGIVLAPSLDRASSTRQAEILRNNVLGTWRHGIWSLDAEDATVTDNTVAVTGTSITLGGRPDEIDHRRNVADITFETQDIEPAVEVFYEPVDPVPVETESATTTGLRCVGLACLWHHFVNFLTDLFPTASAQSLTIPCQPGDTTCQTLQAAVETAVQTLLNAGNNPAYAADFARLRSCEGQPDACFVSAFFHDPSQQEPFTYKMLDAVEDQELDVRFPALGLQTTADTKARRYTEDELQQTWRVLTLCRANVASVTTACNVAPRVFDFGLNVNWASSDRDRHIAAWREKLPAAGTGTSFDRIHGRDATLFVKSATPKGLGGSRVETDGRLLLECNILAAPEGFPHDCLDPIVAVEQESESLLWCNPAIPQHASSIHTSAVQEAPALWSASSACTPLGDPETVEWTQAFNTTDLGDLSDAHADYFNATTSEAQDAALTEAKEVFERVVGARIALSVPGQGMPRSVNEDFLDDHFTHVVARLPTSLQDAAVLQQSGRVLILGGRDADGNLNPNVYSFDPTTRTITTSASDPRLARHSAAAFATGDLVYVFGGSDGEDRADVLTFNTTTNTVTTLDVTLPTPRSAPSLTWDGRARPEKGCPEGCAYIFGGKTPQGRTSSVLRFDPSTPSVTAAGTLPTALSATTAVWNGTAAFIAGGTTATGHVGSILRFDPDTNSTVYWVNMTTQHGAAGSYFDGSFGYVVSGLAGTGLTNKVNRFNALHFQGEVTPVDEPVAGAGVTSLNGEILLFGGRTSPSPSSATDAITKYVNEDHSLAAFFQALLGAGSSYDVVDLSHEGEGANLRLVNFEILDEDGWTNATTPALVALTPVRLTFEINYTGLEGSTTVLEARVILTDRDATAHPDIIAATYGDRLLLESVADDPDNADPAYTFTAGTRRYTHTLPFLELSNATGLAVGGANVTQEVGTVVACVRELFTGIANGTLANLPLPRLAIEPESAENCTTTPITNLSELRFQVPVLMSLEIRDNASQDYNVHATVIHDVYHAAWLKGNTTLAYASARTGVDLTPYALAVEPVALRVVLEIPSDMAAVNKSDLIAGLLTEFTPAFRAYAVEIDDLPLTETLDDAIEAASQLGAVVLVGAGKLPQTACALLPQDKLLTINGLAASPRVITVGAGDASNGVFPCSRRGPTAQFLPKPDLLAPSLGAGTGAAVANVLPFVEALLLRGIPDAVVVKAILASLASPVRNEAGATAAFWEQGFGQLDLTAFIEEPTIGLLLDEAQRDTETPADTLQRLSAAADATPTEVQASSAGLLGLAGDPAKLIALAQGVTLLRLTLDTPAFPQQAVVDFAVVNQNIAGSAWFKPIDYDGVINKTTNALRVLLEDAAYTDTEVDDIVHDAWDLVNISAQEGQDVTLRSVHINIYDLFEKDFLYTTYAVLIEQARLDHGLAPGATQAATDGLVDELRTTWNATTYELTKTASGRATMDVTVDRECKEVAVTATLWLVDLAQRLLQREMVHILGLVDYLPGAGKTLQGVSRVVDTDPRRFISKDDERYLRSQSLQLACLNDQRAALEALRDNATQLRELKRTPSGAWNRTEQETGVWNATPLGDDLFETFEALGIDPAKVSDNNTVVLDAVIDVLDRSIRLIDQKLNLTHIPTITAHPPQGTTQLFTDPAATGNAPLGMYVGLAMMTSRNVTLYDPIAGEPILVRNLTIPVPSVLWNNPTVNWTEVYRDDSPFPNASVILHKQRPRVFASFDVNLTHDAGTAFVDLRARPQTWDGELDAIDDLIAAIDAWNQTHEDLGPFDAKAQQQHADARKSVESWRETVECVAADVECADEMGTAKYTETMLTALFEQRVSRLKYQSNTTNETGTTQFTHLFPGSYELYTPYPYHPLYNYSQNTPAYANPSQGDLGAPLHDLDREVHLAAQRNIEQLTPHPSVPAPDDLDDPPSAGPPQQHPPAGLWAFGNFEVDGSRPPPFHPFNASLNGVDVLGLTCISIQRAQDTLATGQSFPGCGQPILASDITENLTEIRSLADCLSGGANATDPNTDQDCSAVHENVTDAREECLTTHFCGRFRAYQDLRKKAAALEEALGRIDPAAAPSTLFIPWPRSPVRLLQEDPIAYYDREEVCTASLALPENDGKSVSTVCDAVNATLDDVVDLANGTLTITPPPRYDPRTHVLAQAIVHKVTDRIAGTDWFHLDPWKFANASKAAEAAGESLSTEAVLSTLIGEMVGEAQALLTGDKDPITFGAASILELSPSQRVAAFNAGLAVNYTGVAKMWNSSWRANGTVANDSLTFDDPLRPDVDMTATKCREGAAAVAGTPLPFITVCDSVHGSAPPSPMGFADVDLVQFANVVLEESRTASPGGTPVGPAAAQSILTKAVALSASSPERTWRRVDEGIVMESENGTLPSVGLMVYSMPVPVNEFVQVRVDAELVLQNTGVLMVTSGNPLVSTILLDAMASIGDPKRFDPREGEPPGSNETSNMTRNNTIHVYANTLKAIQAAYDTAKHHDDVLIRADLFGMPLVAEEQSSLAPFIAPFGVDTVSTDMRDCVETKRLCERGFAAVRPDGYYNYSRTHEFQTRKRGPGGLGIETLDIFIVYFPSFDGANVTLPQKMVVKDFQVQLDTYIGIGAGAGSFAQMMPIRYRDNAEDWRMLYAVPDVPTSDLTVAFSGAGVPGTFTPTRFLRGMNNSEINATPATLPGRFRSLCPDRAAGGFVTNTLKDTMQGIGSEYPEGGPLFHSTDTVCDRIYLDALRPRKQEFDAPPPPKSLGSFGNPANKPIDALGYVMNVVPLEQFASAAIDFLEAAVVNPLQRLVGIQNPTPVDAEFAIFLLQREIMHYYGTAQFVADGLVSNPFVNLKQAIPFVHGSVNATAQRNSEVNTRADPPALHNWVVMNGTEARALMANPWKWDAFLSVSDSEPSGRARTRAPDLWLNVTTVPLRTEEDNHLLVVAHEYREGQTARTPMPADVVSFQKHFAGEAQALVAHGITGAGLAVRVTAQDSLIAADEDTESFLDGHVWSHDTTFSVTIHRLGGLRTVGSDCSQLPLATYVRAFYRCTGYNATTFSGTMSVGVGMSCYEPALAFMGIAQERARVNLQEAVEEPIFTPGTPEGRALEALTSTPPSLTAAAHLGDAVSRRGNEVVAQDPQYMRALADLIRCVHVENGSDSDLDPESVTDLASEILSLALKAVPVDEIGPAAAEWTEKVQPDLAAGEPQHFVGVQFLVEDTLRNLGAVGLLGPFEVPFAVDEWSTTFASGQTRLDVFEGGTLLSSTTTPISGAGDGQLTPTLVHGRAYVLNATVTDTLGNTDWDEVTFVSDVVPPVVSVAPPSVQYRNATTTLTWQVRDVTSGLLNATLQVFDSSASVWTETGTAMPDALRGTTGVVELVLTVDPDEYDDGSRLRFRLVAKDMAQNSTVSQTELVLDRSAPEVAGLIRDIVLENGGRLVKDETFTSTARAWDNMSGLANVTVVHLKHEDGTNVTDASFDLAFVAGASDAGEVNSTSTPYPDRVYYVRIDAEDRAGNTASVVVDAAEVQLYPDIDRIVPEFVRQDVANKLTIRANITVPGWASLDADWVNLSVTNVTNNEVMAWTNVTDTNAEITLDWTAPEAYEGRYYVNVSSGKAKAIAYNPAFVNTTVPVNGARTITQYQTYSALASTTTEDVWRVPQYASCTKIKVTLSSTDAPPHDVDMYIKWGDPGTVGSGSPYNFTHNSTDPVHVQQWDAAAGSTWTLVVKHKGGATDSDYGLVTERTCSGGGGGKKPPVGDTIESPIENPERPPVIS